MGNPSATPNGAPNNLYSSISSAGAPSQAVEQPQQPTALNPAEQAITEFKTAFDSVQTLLEKPEYAGASKEADLVKRSLENWLEAIVGQLSVPAAGSQGQLY
jgi:hypothetical protein